MANPEIEAPVTTEDVAAKWQEVRDTVRETVEHKVLGMSYLTLGVIALGAGALGTAYYLGKRSAHTPPHEGEAWVKPEAAQPRRCVAALLEPVIDQALRSAVSAVTDRLTYKPSGESRP